MSVPTRRPWLALGLALALAGCDQPTGSTRPRARVAVPPGDPALTSDQPEPPRKLIVGEKTQDIRDPEAEKKAGAVAVEPKITAQDPITLQGNAYVSIIGQAAQGNIKKAVDLYQAETGEFPKTLEEFMDKIIKANNISLPLLPDYQKYGYDAAEHKLVIMQYPDKRKMP